MSEYIYSATTNAFYPLDMKTDYEAAGAWPGDGLEVEESVFTEFTGFPPDGKTRVAGAAGLPVWVDIPPLTQEQLIEQADAQKVALINSANSFMNSKQWPGKAAMGRLKPDEVTQYNLWLDYLDALEAVDTSTAPDIEWPTQPGT